MYFGTTLPKEKTFLVIDDKKDVEILDLICVSKRYLDGHVNRTYHKARHVSKIRYVEVHFDGEDCKRSETCLKK